MAIKLRHIAPPLITGPRGRLAAKALSPRNGTGGFVAKGLIKTGRQRRMLHWLDLFSMQAPAENLDRLKMRLLGSGEGFNEGGVSSTPIGTGRFGELPVRTLCCKAMRTGALQVGVHLACVLARERRLPTREKTTI